MSRKLVTDPWNQNGRKLIRSRDGDALCIFENRPRIFWTYDDQGENDWRLEINCRQTNPYWMWYTYSSDRILNVSGRLLYTSHNIAIPIPGEIEAHFNVGDTSIQYERALTFWVYGLKIHLMAHTGSGIQRDSIFATLESAAGHIFVNGVDRGKWS